MKIQEILAKLKSFRESIYKFFINRRDASVELIDALSSNIKASSVVELSESEFFRRNYSSITRVVDEFYNSKEKASKQGKNNELTQLITHYFPKPSRKNYYVLATDITPAPRLHAPTLEERSYIHAPNPVPGSKPITVGHQYSIAALLPEKTSENASAWVVPFSCQRVSSEEKGTMVGMQQINNCINGNEELKQNLCVSVGDCAYSSPECLAEANKNANQIHITRAKSNRNFNRQYMEKFLGRGRPKRYGELFKLKDNETWGTPSRIEEFHSKTKKGKNIKIKIEAWDNILMRGSNKILMYKIPFRLLRVQVFKENGSLKYNRPLWIMVSGERRNELSPREIYEIYCQRFDVEHFFRYGKERLLMDKFKSMDVHHEEAWWQFVIMSYVQLYLSRELVNKHPKPWEKYLPTFSDFENKNLEENNFCYGDTVSPTQVQNDMFRIIRGIGTFSVPPKPRKKSLGRKKGQMQIKRIRHPIINKAKNKQINSS